MAGRAANGSAAQPLHLPAILSHRCTEDQTVDLATRQAELDMFWPEPVRLQQTSRFGDAIEPVFPPPDVWPRVSVIIPTRDRVELLRMCTGGLARTAYPGSIETIIVDNGSTEPETATFLQDFASTGGKVISAPGEFNFSALNNLAAAQASGEYLLLLNNDVDVLDGGWLETMMRHALRSNRVGAVGALLLYPGGRVQHAGVVIGQGQAAGHVYRGIEPEAVGHRAMHRTTRKVSAVTAACLLVRRQVYNSVGGLDEDAFKVAFNDVDFCLKLRRAGFDNVFAAAACLVHHESESRGGDMDAANLPRFRKELAELQQRWATVGAVDPYHHPLFSYASTDAILAL
jgi:GT2 family glycosyltransferase